MLTEANQNQLKTIAKESVLSGLTHGKPSVINLDTLPLPLKDNAASFVTLNLHGRLSGCIGSLQAYRPLAMDVAENAYAAAFRDYRFSPVTATEFNALEIHISILSPATAINCESEQDLIRQLQPGIDGLIIEDDHHKATFLPSVWESLSEPDAFVSQLKLKAGLPLNYWSNQIRCYRYHTESF